MINTFLTIQLGLRYSVSRGFNAQEGQSLLDTFLYQLELHGINKNPLCYKNPNSPSNIGLILLFHILTG